MGGQDKFSQHVLRHGFWSITIRVKWVPAVHLLEHGPHLAHQHLGELRLRVAADGGALQLAACCHAVVVAMAATHACPPDLIPFFGPQEVQQHSGHVALLAGMLGVDRGPVPNVMWEALHACVASDKDDKE